MTGGGSAAAAVPPGRGAGRPSAPPANAAPGHAAPAPAGPASGSAKTLSIGEVLDELRADYPDVTLSKIRFLEAEGLVEPARTSSNYRKYSAADIARLRFVLSAQRERYLPLRVIRAQLEALDRGLDPGAAGGPLAVAPSQGSGSGPVFADEPAEVRLSRRELLATSGLSEAQLDELERYGLLWPKPGGTYYDGDALRIASAVAEMSRYGIEARHVRAFKAAADREVGLVEQVVTPLLRQRDPQARARAHEATRELATLSVRLHAALVQAGLRAGRAG